MIKNEPEYMTGGISYRTPAAKLSEETWHFANTLFFRIIFASGINVAIIAAVFIVAVLCFTDANGWMLASVMAVFELIYILIPVYITEKFLKKNYNEKGELKEEETDMKFFLKVKPDCDMLKNNYENNTFIGDEQEK
jgi:hypothetical protein